MGGDSGYKLEVIHALAIQAAFAILIDYMSLRLIKGKPLEREDRPYHVFAHPLGLFFSHSSDLAVYTKTFVFPT